jgi:predicted nucleic-acid-binding protein
MLALDTNVLVRFLVRDDTRQFERARRLIEREAERGEPVLVSLLVVLETERVLSGRYGFAKDDIVQTFSDLLDTTEVRFEHEATVERALSVWRDADAEFSDCLLGMHHLALGCESTASFDPQAAKLPGFAAP